MTDETIPVPDDLDVERLSRAHYAKITGQLDEALKAREQIQRTIKALRAEELKYARVLRGFDGKKTKT